MLFLQDCCPPCENPQLLKQRLVYAAPSLLCRSQSPRQLYCLPRSSPCRLLSPKHGDTAPARFPSQLSFKLKHTPTHNSLSLFFLFSAPCRFVCLRENLRQPWTRKPCSPVLPPRPCTAVHWSIRPRLVRIPTHTRPVPLSVHLYPYNIHTLFVSWM